MEHTGVDEDNTKKKCLNPFPRIVKVDESAMNEPDEDVLIANTLVRAHFAKSYEYKCDVCPENSKFDDWYRHIREESHIRNLEQFNLSFHTKSEAKIHCKLCGENFDWDELNIHGKLHLIVPWHEPEDKYRIFFENRIVACETEFYCCLCESIFGDWSTALLHTDDQLHRTLRDTATPLVDELTSKLPAEVTYESLINEALVSFDEKSLQCRICDHSNNVEFAKINRHAKSFLHSWDKITFSGKLKAWLAQNSRAKISENLFEESTPEKFDSSTSQRREFRQNLSRFYLMKLDDATFVCNICNCRVFASARNINIHAGGKSHAVSLRKYGCDNIVLKEGNIYSCRCCECEIIGIEEVYLHVKSVYHSIGAKLSEIFAKLRIVSTKFETPEQSSIVSEFPSPSLSDYYIAKLSENVSRCKICDFSLVGTSMSILRHLSGTLHSMSLKKYGCENIIRRTKNVFYCRCCDRDIYGHDRVCVHIREPKHINSFESPSIVNQQSSVADKSSIEVAKLSESTVAKSVSRSVSHYIRRPRPPKPLEPLFPNIVARTIPSNYIKRQNVDNSCCIVCNIKLLNDKEVDEHAIASLHELSMIRYGCEYVSLIAGNLYYCQCCNCRIFGTNNVYLHVKGRQHDMEHLAERRKKKLDETKKSTQTVQPEKTKVVLSSILTSEVTKMLEQVKSKEAVNASRPCRYGIRLPNPRKTLADEHTRCNVCNVSFVNSAELHAHLAIHFSVDFVHTCANKSSSDATTIAAKQGSAEAARNFNEILKNGTNEDNIDRLKSTTTSFVYECDTESEDSQTRPRTPTKSIMQKVVQTVDFDDDCIYEIADKFREIELGMKLWLLIDKTRIYCLVCRKIIENTLQNYFEHLRGLNHSNYLERMEYDDKLFGRFEEQFSDMALAREYMEETTDETIICHVCHDEISNIDDAIRRHIGDKKHRDIRKDMHENARKSCADLNSRIHCDWYNVHKYWCVLCSAMCETEISFVKHMESSMHSIVVNQPDNADKTLIYDFCAPCALLFYGYRCTYAYHCNLPSHKWLMQDGHYVIPELPKSANTLLSTVERYIDDTIVCLNDVAAKEREKERNLMEDLENAVKTRFCNASAYGYGSRVSGLGGPDSDIDVFLDCGNMYNGNVTSKDRLSSLMTSVHQCLNKYQQSWELNELLTNCRTPIIRARHRSSGLSCNVSFENGLSVENTKLIKSFNDVYPPCREMILFLKKWLTLCKLSGSDRISSYALYWCVIFYLQKELILPSIATLTRMNSRSHEIAGWEVGITRDYTYNKAESNFTTKELLTRFFTFYADFDFRRDVMCPLLGYSLAKREFANHHYLPKEMRPYVDRMKKSDDPEPLRIDSPMCLQDPLDLQHNITKAVSKVFLNRFRMCCSKSVDVLNSSS